MFFTPEKIMLLKGTSLFGLSTINILALALKDQFTLAQQYLHIRNFLKLHGKSFISEEKFTLQAFKWARAITLTRQNSIPHINVQKHQMSNKPTNLPMQLALIPLYDMFNHRSGIIDTFYDTERNVAETFSSRSYEIGEEIFIMYGARSNQNLFQYCGFVGNVHIVNDCIKIFLTINQNDSLFEKKKYLFNQCGISR
jgi:histone-lysine N-methyltransferase SETD3